MGTSMVRIGCLWLGLLAASSALSQDKPAGPAESNVEVDPAAARAEYERLIQRGIAEFNLAHWAEARAFFLRAHAIRPSARTLRSLGLVSYELRSYVAAVDYLQAALTNTVLPLTPPMRAEVSSALEEAASFIAHVEIVLDPRDATLRIDDKPVTRPADGIVLLDPGEHEISAARAGFEPLTRIYRAHGGENSRLHLQLRASMVAQAAPALEVSQPSQQRATAQPESTSNAGLTTGQHFGIGFGIAAVAALGLGTTFSIIAVNENMDSNRSCDEDGCDEAGREHREDAQAHADVATGCFIGAAALLGTAAVLFFATGSDEQESASAVLTPLVGPGTAAIAYRGAF